MLVTNHISKDFIPPKINQTVGHALDLVNDYQLSHIPVFEGLNFVGNLSKETLEESDEKLFISDIIDLTEHFFLSSQSSLFDAIQLYNNHLSNILPVLDHEMHYIGFLMMDDVTSALSAMPFIAEPGSIMTVSIGHKQFSISEVSKIVESNNAKIIAVFVTSYQEDKVCITIKLVAENLSSVGETFERFGYVVEHKFYHDEKEDMIKDRFGMLMKYLDI